MMKTASERFMGRVYPEPNTGCWLWGGALGPKGYGSFASGGRKWIVHRFSWFLHRGEDPGTMCVLHRCDNPPCVNPDHLFLGTKGENNRDRDAKGRGHDFRGGKHPQSKLTDDAVRDIRTSCEPQVALAKRYGVDASTVSHARSGKRWSHVKP